MTMLGWPIPLRRSALLLLAALALACACLRARAEDSPGFRRRLWTTEAGTPADIWAMAQGSDG